MAFGFQNFGLTVPLDLGDGYMLDGFVLSVQGDGMLADLGGGSWDWTNPEQGTSYLVFEAEISGPAPVPLPAAAWMLMAGIGGLGAMKRRSKKKAA